MFPAYLQEAFFGKTLLDQSKRAILAPPTQRHTQGVLRPPIPGLGAKNTASEPGKTLHQSYNSENNKVRPGKDVNVCLILFLQLRPQSGRLVCLWS